MVETNELTITGSGPDDETNVGTGLAITHYLKLNGTLDLVGESQLVQKRYTPEQFSESTLDASSSGFLERDQQGTSNLYNYNYWGSPVNPVNPTANNTDYSIGSILRDGTNSNNPLNLLWTTTVDANPNTSPITLSSRWLYAYENYPIGDYASWRRIGQTETIAVGLGYIMKGSGASSTEQNYVFVGKPNNCLLYTSPSPRDA